MKKPIGRTAHGLIDYGFAALTAAVPFLLGLTKRARYSALGLTGVMLGYTLATDYRPAPIRRIPFRTHRVLDIGSLAGLVVVPALAGAMKKRKARSFFGSMVALGVATILLTDWDADA